MSDIVDMPTFEYREVVPADLGVKAKTYEVKAEGVPPKVPEVSEITLRGEVLSPSDRFWCSVWSRYQVTQTIFRYFTHREVFDRISRTVSRPVRLCIQRTPYVEDSRWEGQVALGVSSPGTKKVYFDDAVAALGRLSPEGMDYRAGTMVSLHSPERGGLLEAGPDSYSMKFQLEIPVDGYGMPVVIPLLSREGSGTCIAGDASVFRSGVTVGKKDSVVDTICRVVESYSNEEAFSAMQQRMTSAQRSYASLLEALSFLRLLKSLLQGDFRLSFIANMFAAGDSTPPRAAALASFWDLVGDMRAQYGVAQLASISEKRMRAIPVRCTVYELLCLASELATHQLTGKAVALMNKFTGAMISREYDLEESKTEFGEFEDFVSVRSRLSYDAGRALIG